MKIYLHKYGQYIRYAFDLSRFFPIIIKQRGVSKLIAGIGSHIIEAPHTIWTFIINLNHQMANLFSGVIPGWISEMSLFNPFSSRIDIVIQSVLG